MFESRKNTRGQVILALFCAVTFLCAGVVGIRFDTAAVLRKGSTPAHYLLGEQAVLLAVLYLGFSAVFIAYLFRFNRWHRLIFAFLFLLWLAVSTSVLMSR